MAPHRDMVGSFTGRKVEDSTLRPQREEMTKERKMGVVNSAWGDFMAACNLLMGERAAESERQEGKGEKSCSERRRRRRKMKTHTQRRALVPLISHSQISWLPVLA